MYYQGLCRKMQTALDQPFDFMQLSQPHSPFRVSYTWHLDGFPIKMNALLQSHIQLIWTGQIFCIQCGKKTQKSYAQGYCYLCFKAVPQTDLCMVRPETCHYHAGTCRDPQFAEQVCFQPHFVYLANSSALKIGITRASNMPTRWLDQGASQAMPIMQVSSRRLSGILEQIFAQNIADKTNWRTLLKGDSPRLDLQHQKQQLIQYFHSQLTAIKTSVSATELIELSSTALEFQYPVLQYPQKIISHNLDKQTQVQGVLQGIKGQYLLLDSGVINLRKYTGYELICKVGESHHV